MAIEPVGRKELPEHITPTPPPDLRLVGGSVSDHDHSDPNSTESHQYLATAKESPLLVVANLHSTNGNRVEKLVAHILEATKNREASTHWPKGVEVLKTRPNPADTEEEIRERLSTQPGQVVIASGGDSTMRLVAGALLRYAQRASDAPTETPTILLAAPGGNACNLAWNAHGKPPIDISNNDVTNLLFQAGRMVNVYPGEISFINPEEAPRTELFMTIGGIGLTGKGAEVLDGWYRRIPGTANPRVRPILDRVVFAPWMFVQANPFRARKSQEADQQAVHKITGLDMVTMPHIGKHANFPGLHIDNSRGLVYETPRRRSLLTWQRQIRHGNIEGIEIGPDKTLSYIIDRPVIGQADGDTFPVAAGKVTFGLGKCAVRMLVAQ